MKKNFLAGAASAALLLAGASAFAADLPRRTTPVGPIAPYASPIPIFTWTGFYVGVNAGYGFGTNDEDVAILPNGVAVRSGDDNGGFVGGGQIGYNYQFGAFVVGLETDLQFADLGRRRTNFDFFDTNNNIVPGLGGGGSLDYFGTVRARAGYAFDRLLIFATGGFAYGGLEDRFCQVGVRSVECGDDGTVTGWTVGGGVEYAFTNNITAKVEGLYVNLGAGNRAVVDVPTGVTFPAGQDIEFGVVRAGLNYKF